MPPFIRVCPNAIAVQCVALYQEQTVENTFYFLGSAPADGGTVEAMCDLVDGIYNTAVMPLLVADVAYEHTTATALDTATSPQYTSTTNTGNAGGVLLPGLPASVALAITRYTALRGRSFRGRNYVFGIPEEHVTGRTVDITYAASLVAAYTLVDLSCEPLSLLPAVISWNQDHVRSNPGIPTPVIGRRVFDLIVDSQRRRLH